MLKDLRIFVASSKELLPERNALAYFVLAHEDEFAKRGLRVRLSKWEYVDPKMTEERTEDRYLDEMLNCDAVLMLFRHVLGKYTKEEVDKAIAAEVAGTSRIKKHLILFKEGDADESPELAAWRSSLAEGTYGTFTDAVGLGAHFLRLVEQIAGLPLQDVADAECEKTISAFLAVDDELAIDRDAFADAVLNLNDVLSHRGTRVRLRFYDPACHRDMLDNSEMALVLYQTKCGAFGTSALKESYDRAKEEKNPKRLYVFFRDAAGKPLDADFQTFKDGFAEAFGSSPCRFENVDTLSLNFLFALESVLGDGAGTFVKLDGRMVVADGLEVGDLTKLPMLEKNTGIADLFSRMEDVSKRFVAQREKCDRNPQDDGLYVELLDLSAEKNRLQDQIDRELKMSFNLAKRLAAISIAQVNETIARARAKVEEGDIKGALEILDGASSALKRRRLLHKAADRAEAEELQIKELKASAEIEYFRVDAVMAYTAMPFEDRFKKSEMICKRLIDDIRSYADLCALRNQSNVYALLSEALTTLVGVYDAVGDWVSPIPLLEEVLAIYCEKLPGKSCCDEQVIKARVNLATLYRCNNRFADSKREYECLIDGLANVHEKTIALQICFAKAYDGLAIICVETQHMHDAEEDFRKALSIYRNLGVDQRCMSYAGTTYNFGRFYSELNDYDSAERYYKEAISLFRSAEVKPGDFDLEVSICLEGIANLYRSRNMMREAEGEYSVCEDIRMRLAKENPIKLLPQIANCHENRAIFNMEIGQTAEAGHEFLKALEIRRRLSRVALSKYGEGHARLLKNCAIYYEQIGDNERALSKWEDALVLFHELASVNPNKFDDGLSEVLTLAAMLYIEVGKLEMAAACFSESRSIRERLASEHPGEFDDALAETLHEQAKLLIKCGDMAGAKSNLDRAMDIRSALVAEDQKQYKDDLEDTKSLMASLAKD